jgi:NAD(P)-dependent dehydrogenase (short-subunit alcohol dehydrogenase family)
VGLIQGASRGIGLALVRKLLESEAAEKIYATCRDPASAETLRALDPGGSRVTVIPLDVTSEPTITSAARQVAGQTDRLDYLINCSGILHEPAQMRPERRLQEIKPETLATSFQVNATGPLLVLREFEQLLKKSSCARVMTLSARVGSIADNRLGGWYGYRTSKAALNQMVRTLAIEWRRLTKPILCVVMHPGTVSTELSRPFTTGLSGDKIFSPDRAAQQLLEVFGGLSMEDSGRFFSWDGQQIPW